MTETSAAPAGDPRALLRHLLDGAVAAAQPDRVLASFLPPPPRGRTVVVGAGKAAAAMAAALDQAWPGPLQGLVVTRYHFGLPAGRISVAEAAHPVPDANGHDAAGRILGLVSDLTADDLVIALVSGGGSALLALPPPGVPLQALSDLSRQLLACGADITQMNTVRKHCSAILGGRLALAAAAVPMVTLAISDVPGDDPATIGSGPTVPDSTSRADALAVVRHYGLNLHPALTDWLNRPDADNPGPGHPCFANKQVRIIASPLRSLEAAADLARQQGITPLILGDLIEGEAREVARVHAGIALAAQRHGHPLRPPCLLLSGGETTVTLRRDDGRGGRNSEFLLALALALNGAPGIHALAADTDGIDGSEDNAGAIITPDTLARAAAAGCDARARLDANDAYGFFQAIGDLVHTGPTRTNVNDFRAILITA